jgi:diacylglycerol kinase
MPSLKESFSYAIKGLDIFWKEKHIKIHVLAMLLVTVAGFYFHITQTEWLICLVLFALVISLEIVNTAIEHIVNLVSPEYNPLAGKIKDLAAGAVLFSAIIAFISGCLIFTKYILALF